MISAKSEVGIVYGKYEMDKDLVCEFVAWLIRNDNVGGYLLSRHQPASCEFNACWRDISDNVSSFVAMQGKFIKEYSH